MRQGLADEKHLVTSSLDGLADDVFGSAIGIHLGGVDEPHPEVEPQPKRRDFARAMASIFTHSPRALTECNDRLAGWKRYCSNVCRDVHVDDSAERPLHFSNLASERRRRKRKRFSFERISTGVSAIR